MLKEKALSRATSRGPADHFGASPSLLFEVGNFVSCGLRKSDEIHSHSDNRLVQSRIFVPTENEPIFRIGVRASSQSMRTFDKITNQSQFLVCNSKDRSK
jgi:hypothetical protein